MSAQSFYNPGYPQFSNIPPARQSEEQPGAPWTPMPTPSRTACDTTMGTHHFVVPTPPLSPSAPSDSWAWQERWQLQSQLQFQTQSSHAGQAHYFVQPPLYFPAQYQAQSQHTTHPQSLVQPLYLGQQHYSATLQHALQPQQAFHIQQPFQPQQDFQLQHSVQPQYQSLPARPMPPPHEDQPPHEHQPPNQPSSEPRPRSRSRSRTPARARRTPEPPLYFYNRNEDYYEFTNFAPFPVWHGGNQYPTSEHLFQAYKFLETDPRLAEHIRQQPSPRAALQEATRNRAAQRKDWFHVNIFFMDSILEAKFTQHQGLRELLLSTGNRELIEDSPVDAFWGCGADRKGKNELGKCLMRLRSKFLEQERRQLRREEERQDEMMVDKNTPSPPTRALPEPPFQGY